MCVLGEGVEGVYWRCAIVEVCYSGGRGVL